jgi:hypothetical protein
MKTAPAAAGRLFGFVLLAGVALLPEGCIPAITPEAPAGTGVAVPMTQPPPIPLTPGLQGLIESARQDLARRLSIPLTQISLLEATEVEWADSSLGCPQPDMAYLQVITPGYRILLEANAREYEYHSNRDAYIVYCENPDPSGLPKP